MYRKVFLLIARGTGEGELGAAMQLSFTTIPEEAAEAFDSGQGGPF